MIRKSSGIFGDDPDAHRTESRRAGSGKGVLICNTREEAKEGVKTLMMDKQFGSAGDRIVVEEFMTGREVSVLSFVDGHTIKIMTSAQDHKRAKDGDQGLNTGGMGTFSPQQPLLHRGSG